jgi:hypothetical protein
MAGCALTAWETHREATSQIARGQDRHESRATGNRFETIRENAVDAARIVESRSDRMGGVEERVEVVNLGCFKRL